MQQKRYWLRGGIIADLVVFASALALMFFGGAMVHTPVWVFVLIPGSEISSKITGQHFFYGFNFFLIILISLLFYFTIGAIIGWIFGKIKNKNSVT